MKKYLSLFLVAIVTLFSFNSFAYTAPSAPARGYVLDETGKLSKSDIERLNRKIESLKQNTKNEYGVAVIQSTGGDDIADVGQTIFRAWGIGNKQLNNGVLLVIALAERKTRIQTGKGAEGDLPDLKANDILQKTLKPLLKQGKFYEGIDATLDAMSSSMDNRTQAVAQLPKQAAAQLPKATTTSLSKSEDSNAGWIIMAIIFGAGVLFLIMYRTIQKDRKEEARRDQERQKSLNDYYDNLSRQRSQRYEQKAVAKDTFHSYIAPVAVAGVAAATISEVEKARKKREDDASRRRKKETETKKSYSSDYSSSYSSGTSYSSYDSGSSSSSYDSGGFSGGDSGGGGSSGDF